MTEPLDVDARLAEGRPAVENVGNYVWACHLLGYQNPDLTLHPAQVRDWYGSEDGLNLHALEADRVALSSVANATDDVQQLQDRQLDALSDAWQGRGGDASREFLSRHGEASAATASAVRNAVDALTALRDDLWHAVDEKVAATVEIDDRRQAERAQWLAATRTVTTGAGDRAMASELIDQQMKPFVDNDIRADWLAAMQKAMAAVSAAFDVATGALTGDSPAAFEVPGDLGPVGKPAPAPPAPDVSVTAPAGWPSPAAVAAPASPAPMPASAFSAVPDALVPPTPAAMAAPPAMATPPASSTPPLGDMGGGLPGGAGGLAGLGSQLADAIGGLLDRPDAALPDPPELVDEPVDDQPVDDEEVVDDEQANDEDAEVESDAENTVDDEDDVPEDDCPVDEAADTEPTAEPLQTPPPEPMPPPPAIAEPPPAEPLGAQTPCEIAADELPQAGPEG